MRGEEHVTKGGGRKRCTEIRHALEHTHCNGKCERTPDTSMLRQVSIRALLVGYNLGDVLKILWIYISVGTGNLVGWRQGRLETRWAESRRVGNGQRALAQTALRWWVRARLGVRDSLSTNFHSGHSLRGFRSVRERARETRWGHITMDATDDHRDSQMAGWRGHFHFHTTRLKGFSSTETLHLEVSWNAGNHCTESGNARPCSGVGVFLNDSWKRLHYCVKMTSLENCLAT